MSFEKDPQMGKNFWLAMALSLLVLMGYPALMRWLSPPAPVQQEEVVENEPTSQIEDELPAQQITPNPTTTSPPQIQPVAGEAYFEKPAPPEEFVFENEIFEVGLSTLGGSVTYLNYKGDEVKFGGLSQLFYEGNANVPGIFGVRILHQQEDLTQAIFKATQDLSKRGQFEFVYEKPNEYRLTKRYLIDRNAPVIKLSVAIENFANREKHFPLEFIYGMDHEETKDPHFDKYEAVTWTNKAETANIGKISKKGFSVSNKDIAWTGIIRRYFAFLIKPDWKTLSSESEADSKTIWTTVRMEPVSVEPSSKTERNFFIYAGPQEYQELKSFGLGFENILQRGFFGIFQIWLLIALRFCNQFTHNYGWSIILVTLVIKLLFTPLTHMSFESMKKMQALQPKLKGIQERFKSDPSKMNKEMMALYKRNKVNPMSGCLPMLLQIPIFFAFYRVLAEAIEIHGAPFIFWINDLSQPDRLIAFPQSFPLIGDGLNILPILMLLSMFWQQRLTPQAGATPEQTKIMAFMPLIFGFIFYKMPSGLVLYWFVSNVLSIIHQVFVKRMVIVLHHEDRD